MVITRLFSKIVLIAILWLASLFRLYIITVYRFLRLLISFSQIISVLCGVYILFNSQTYFPDHDINITLFLLGYVAIIAVSTSLNLKRVFLPAEKFYAFLNDHAFKSETLEELRLEMKKLQLQMFWTMVIFVISPLILRFNPELCTLLILPLMADIFTNHISAEWQFRTLQLDPKIVRSSR